MSNTYEQLTTFYVDGNMFGIEVLNVQEVAGSPLVFSVPCTIVCSWIGESSRSNRHSDWFA